jgi:hypothetical protein
MPIAWKGTVVQYAGDYVDAHLQVLRRMFAKRLRAYRSLGYELVESASGVGARELNGAATERWVTAPAPPRLVVA